MASFSGTVIARSAAVARSAAGREGSAKGAREGSPRAGAINSKRKPAIASHAGSANGMARLPVQREGRETRLQERVPGCAISPSPTLMIISVTYFGARNRAQSLSPETSATSTLPPDLAMMARSPGGNWCETGGMATNRAARTETVRASIRRLRPPRAARRARRIAANWEAEVFQTARAQPPALAAPARAAALALRAQPRRPAQEWAPR